MSEKAKFAAHLQSVLKSWSELPDEHPLEQFLAGIVGEIRATEILETLASIKQAHKEVQGARENGRTRAAWLGDVLKQELPDGAWSDFLDSPIQRVVDISKGMPQAAVAASFVDLSIGTLSIAEDVLGEVLLPESEITVLKKVVDFFQSPLGSDSETSVKAVASAAAVDFLEGSNAQIEASAITAAVDLGLEMVKVGYQVAIGEENSARGLERLQDRSVAAVASVVRQIAPKIGEKVGQAVGSALGAMIGMAPVGAMAGRVLGRMAGEYVAEYAEVGVKTIVKTVKSVSRSIAKATSSIWTAAKSFVGGFFGA